MDTVVSTKDEQVISEDIIYSVSSVELIETEMVSNTPEVIVTEGIPEPVEEVQIVATEILAIETIVYEIEQIGTPMVKGEKGDPGEPGNMFFTLIANMPLSGHRVIATLSNGLGVYADNHDQYKTIVGVSTGASDASSPITVQSFGKMSDPSFNFVPGDLFLSIDGFMVVGDPGDGAYIQLGHVIDSHTIFININSYIERM